MNNQNRQPRRVGGGAKDQAQRPVVRQPERAANIKPPQRPAGQKPQGRPTAGAPAQRKENGWVMPEKRPGAGPQRSDRGYTQMPLRPMTSMQKQRPAEGVAKQRSYGAVNYDPYASYGRPTADGRKAGQIPRAESRDNGPVKAAPLRSEEGAKRPAPKNAPPKNARPQRPAQKQRPPQKKAAPPKRNEKGPARDAWIIPEGSPVYTARGRMYEGRRGAPEHQGAPYGQRAVRNERPPQKKRPPAEARKKKTFNKKKLLHGVKIFFVRLVTMLLVFSLLGLWWFRAEFYSSGKSRSGTVSYAMNEGDSYSSKAALAYEGDVLYVDFTEISDWFGMVCVGSINTMRFICTDGAAETSAGNGGEEYTIFTRGSASAVINGTVVELEGECRTVDSHIWVPLSFVENYISGIVCEKNASGDDITFYFEGDEEEDEKDEKDEKEEEEIPLEEKYARVGFCVKRQLPLDRVAYPERERP